MMERADPKTYTVDEAAQLLGVGRTLAYEQAAADNFPVPVIKIGKRLLVPKAPLDRLLAGETK